MWNTVILHLFWTYFVNSEDSDFKEVRINGEKVPVSSQNSVGGNVYNYSGTFRFQDGQAVNFDCDKNIDIARMKITTDAYKNYANIETNTTTIYKNKTISMYLKLTKENDGNYIECYIRNDHKNRNSVIRIHFKLISEIPDFSFRVNSLIVPEKTIERCPKLCFEYNYYDGENVTVETLKNSSVYGDISCDFKDRDNTSRPNYIMSTILQNNGVKNISCSLKTRQGDNMKPSLRFVSNGVGHTKGPIIKTLPMHKILAMFMFNETDINIKTDTEADCKTSDYVILYDYAENETLNIQCETSSGLFPNLSHDSRVNQTDHDFDVRKEIGYYKLKTGIKSGNITCKDPSQNSTTKIVLIQTRANSGGKQTNFAPNTLIAPSNSKNYGPKNKYTSNSAILIGVTIALMLFIVVLGFVFAKLLKNRQTICQMPKPDSNYYETLPEHNQGAMPIPSQWRDLQYTAPADILPHNSDYAVPYQPTLEDMYTIPDKHLRDTHSKQQQNKNVPTKDTKKTNLHDLMTPTSSKNIANPETIKNIDYINLDNVSNIPYARMISNGKANGNEENPYADMNGYGDIFDESNKPHEDYDNVFDGQSYANCSDKNEYAEPAYCELSEVLW